MNPAATMADAVAAIVPGNLPVLCLDTCDFMDVIRGVAEDHLYHAQSFREILNALASGEPRFQIVVTYLVRHEWEQNKGTAIATVRNFLGDLAGRARRIEDVRRLAGLEAPKVDEILFDPSLGESLLGLAEAVLEAALVLRKHEPCVARALDRVMDRRRPSHQREIKDSINWEHFLELTGRLAAAGHAQPRIFVSANKKDFWADVTGKLKEKLPTIHLDLKADADAAGLQFFGRLDLALRVLNI